MDLIPALKSFTRKHFPFVAGVIELNRQLRKGCYPIYLDYRVEPRPRYGWGKPGHQILQEMFDANRSRYASFIDDIRSFDSGLRAIPCDAPGDPLTPCWSNGYITGIDAIALYALPAMLKSKLYIEVGSGNSTKFVRKSIADNKLAMKVVSIDPYPRAEIDALCDDCLRHRLEDVDLGLFDRLQAGDILMIDNSHRCFQNSDVTTVFLDILPRLNKGVVVYIDDMFIPHDYPPDWASRYYSEQYLLAVLLLADAQRRYEVLFPAWFCSSDPELRKAMKEAWRKIGLGERVQLDGNGLWLRVNDSR